VVPWLQRRHGTLGSEFRERGLRRKRCGRLRVAGRSNTGTGTGVYGEATSGNGVQGNSTSGNGVQGNSISGGNGVWGEYTGTIKTQGDTGNGVVGKSSAANGVWGSSTADDACGVLGKNTNNDGTANSRYGVAGIATGTTAYCVGVMGQATGSGGYAGIFYGPVSIDAPLTNARTGFKIDHPLEPRAKYLNHSSVESPDMKNVYDGVETLDSDGSAWVKLPSWFEALNRDFRYQLTPIGSYAAVYVAQEIANNRFKIAGGRPDQRISWLVTGIRRDAWAEKNPMAVEENKDAADQGKFLHPAEADHPREMGIPYSRTRALEVMFEPAAED
jgi:hypothetical protein